MLPEIPEEQVRRAVEGTAEELLAEAGFTRPPVDAFELADRLGIMVARDGLATTRARYVRLGESGLRNKAAILLADDPRPERRQWAVAHEIGESQAHRVFAELGVDPADATEGAREGIANRLAGALLLPRRRFMAKGSACEWDLLSLKAKFSTASHELIARRMLEAPPTVIVTLFDQGKPAWRKSNLGRRPPRLAAPELAAWRAAHETGMAARCERDELPEGIDDVRAWAVHEPGWRREFVRTEVRSEE